MQGSPMRARSSDVVVEEINSTALDCWVHLRTLRRISVAISGANSKKVSHKTQLNQPLLLFVAHPERGTLTVSDAT